MNLYQLLEQVTDQESFFTFVEALIADRMEVIKQEEREHILSRFGTPNGWQNWEIESFLDGALAWAKSTDMGQTEGLPEGPSWKAFAVFLYCGKIYE